MAIARYVATRRDIKHRMSGLGATMISEGATFRVWAPGHETAVLVLDGKDHALTAEPDGYFAGTVNEVRAGARYRFRLDGKEAHPDPCSRFQPDGPHGDSEVVDPSTYAWKDGSWRGAQLAGQVIYELHVGTFTKAGTWAAAVNELPALRDLGITLIEIMPIAEFPGRWNWGYDGVDLWAPFHGYGRPDDFRAFVDAAHAHGLAVILDVVYNHLGPDGNYLAHFTKSYFTDRYPNDWGESINFDGDDAGPVREFFIENACYWVRDFHLDGLRLDATQSIIDHGPRHVLAELTVRVRAAAHWPIVIVAENEPQDVRLIRSVERGGYGIDAMWNDDFHHSAMVALTGRREGYYHDYLGHAQEFVSALKRGFLYQGQRYDWQKNPRGSRVTDEPAGAFIHFIQNHDQVGNTLFGERIDKTAAAGRLRALTAVMLLGPETPMLFMGQEFGATNCFCYFADHEAELAAMVHKGRKDFLRQFKTFAVEAAQAVVPNPAEERLFELAKLDRSQAKPEAVELYKSLLALRREDPVIASQRRDRIDGGIFNDHAFVIRWFDDAHGDRLLVVNLGGELVAVPAPDPLLAPMTPAGWEIGWSSDDPRFGGPGAAHPCEPGGWRLPGESAVFLVPARHKEPA